MAKRRNIIDEVMKEHIPMPGFPSLIVTRGSAWEWMMRFGYSGKPGGPADYAVFATAPSELPLSDTQFVDSVLSQFLT